MRRVWIAGPLLLGVLAGCDGQHPSFLARLQQDCQSGDRDACGLLAGPPMAPGLPQPSSLASKPRTAVQRDVDAIMQGMDRSRLESQTRVIPDDGG
jgi:hypothetical protein